MFQSEKKLSGSTQKMNRTDTWVVNYFNKCFNLKRSCRVLLRRWIRQILGSSTTLTNVSIWKEVAWFFSEDINKTDTWVINYFNKCFNLKRSCLVLLRRWTGQILGLNKTDTWVINYFNKCVNLKRSCLVLLRRWTGQIPESSTTINKCFSLKRSRLVPTQKMNRTDTWVINYFN